MKKSHMGIAAALIAAVAIILFLVLGGKEGKDDKGSKQTAIGGDTDTAGEGGSGKGIMPPPVTPGERPPRIPGKVGGPEVPGAQLDPTAAANRYAPTSRPMTDKDVGHLQPLAGDVATGSAANPRDPAAPKLGYVFKTDVASVTGAGAIRFSLSVHKGGAVEVAERVPAKVLGGSVRAVEGQGEREVAKLALSDDDGDLFYTAEMIPAQQSFRDASGFYRAYVQFQVGEQAPIEARLGFRYTQKREVPARFTGKIEDRAEGGNLIISAEVEVFEPGTYRVAANLYDAGGRPLGRAHDRRPYTKKGKVMANLTFQGLIFHDQGRPGPYIVRYVRGYRETGRDNGQEDFPALAGEHKTDDYAIEQFSSKPWKTP